MKVGYGDIYFTIDDFFFKCLTLQFLLVQH